MPAMMHDASGGCKRNGAADGGRRISPGRRVPRSGRAAPAPRRWKPLRQGGPQNSGREVAGRPRGRFPPTAERGDAALSDDPPLDLSLFIGARIAIPGGTEEFEEVRTAVHL